MIRAGMLLAACSSNYQLDEPGPEAVRKAEAICLRNGGVSRVAEYVRLWAANDYGEVLFVCANGLRGTAHYGKRQSTN